jgi:hypothetical protein
MTYVLNEKGGRMAEFDDARFSDCGEEEKK